jgi:hypothetical protein
MGAGVKNKSNIIETTAVAADTPCFSAGGDFRYYRPRVY